MADGNIVIIGFLSYLTLPLSVLLVAIIYHEAVSGQVILGMAIIQAAAIIGRVLVKSQQQ